MFKKTRLRISLLIMTIATVVITLMLMVIYVANQRNSFERSISLLESYVDDPMGRMHPDDGMQMRRPDAPPDMKDNHDRMLKLSTFYSVLYDQDGIVIRVDCNDGNLYSEQEIVEIADSILQRGKARGNYNRTPFLIRKVDEGTLVALIDNTMEVDNFDRLFTNSFIVGSCAWLIILILSLYFSKKIVYPLEQNDIRQKQFVSDAGHELKTPISVISANADILSREIGDNKWLSNILYENERMGNLVKQLLELVRAENKSQTMEHLDFSRLVSGGALPFESVAYEKGLTINTDIDEGIYIEGNQNQLSQLVSILIDNAIQHGTDGKEVIVRLHTVKNHVVLSVINSGPPIPDDVKTRLFERFYRADEARSEDGGHYGLGLAIARAIAIAHNGKLELSCYDGLIEFKFILQ